MLWDTNLINILLEIASAYMHALNFFQYNINLLIFNKKRERNRNIFQSAINVTSKTFNWSRKRLIKIIQNDVN